jgi:oligopeptide/dipeptide ABC transporter ATP-binding protein
MDSAATTLPPSIRPGVAVKPLVSVRGVSKRFPVERDLLGRPTRWLSAVDDVSLDIYPGETLGLIGESGSGKSTLGRLILRLLSASSGSVTFEDIDVQAATGRQLRAFRQKAQIVFQDPFGSLDPRMSVEAILTEGMSYLGMTRDQQSKRVAELLDIVGLPAVISDRFPHEFSGGQRQRISIARALAVNPIFLVADEPVSALDVSIQGQILNLMRDLQARLNLTYLFIGHDLSVIRHIADRVAVMYLGKIVEVAPTKTLFENPLHPYTQALLSSVPSLSQKRGRAQRIRLEGEIPTAIDPPRICRFAGRCFRSIDVCRQQEPPLEAVAAERDVEHVEHFVACFNYQPMKQDETK